jgi:glycosyltransferase involved in cell wall biosynthesis
VLSIGFLTQGMPRPDAYAGDDRLVKLMKLAHLLGHNIYLLVDNGRDITEETYVQAGIHIWPTTPERVDQLKYVMHLDILWIEFYFLAERYLDVARRACLADRIVIDSVDAHSLREYRQARLYNDANLQQRARLTACREKKIYARADAVIAVSYLDAEYLRTMVPRQQIYVVGNIHPTHTGQPMFSSRENSIMFVGGFGHAPNVDAVAYFVRHIFPRVLDLNAGVRFEIIGSNVDRVEGLPYSEHIRVIGWVESVERHLRRARALVAPLRFGAGVKGKIGQAMASGLPVVTSSIGAEGMGIVHNRQALIADDATRFASAINQLCSDPDLWHRISSAAISHAAEQYSPEIMLHKLRRVISAIATDNDAEDV